MKRGGKFQANGWMWERCDVCDKKIKTSYVMCEKKKKPQKNFSSMAHLENFRYFLFLP